MRTGVRAEKIVKSIVLTKYLQNIHRPEGMYSIEGEKIPLNKCLGGKENEKNCKINVSISHGTMLQSIFCDNGLRCE